MQTWEVRNAIRKNLLGLIEWENTKKYNDLIAVLKRDGFLTIDESKAQIFLESFGLAFSIIDSKSGSEILYVKLKVD